MSELDELLSRRLLPAGDSAEPATHRITVRMTADLHQKLVQLASAFGMSKTATCEDITTAAIKDSFARYLSTMQDDESDHLLHLMHQEMEEQQRLADEQAISDAHYIEQQTIGLVRAINNGAQATYEGEILK